MANWIVAFSVLILFACNGDLTISSRSTPTEGDREDANAAVEMPDPDIDGEGADVEMPDSGEEDEG